MSKTEQLAGEHLAPDPADLGRLVEFVRSSHSPGTSRGGNQEGAWRCLNEFSACRGTVTLPNDERNNWPAHLCSRRANCLMPCLHSRSPETAVRFSRNEVALDVEGVVGGSMNGEKSLG